MEISILAGNAYFPKEDLVSHTHTHTHTYTHKVFRKARSLAKVHMTNRPVLRMQLPPNPKGNVQGMPFYEKILEGPQTQTKGTEMNGQCSKILTLT